MKPTPDDITLLRKLLDVENPYYRLSDESFARLTEVAEVIDYDRGQTIIAQNTVNPHVYILLDGIFRSWHWIGDRDETITFGSPGTLFVEMCCFFTGEKASYSYEACSPSRIIRIRKEQFDRLVELSHDFARWSLSMANSQLFYYERKYSVISGTAGERYESMLRDRPQILRLVPLHQIASYLGITPQHLSRLRRESGCRLKE